MGGVVSAVAQPILNTVEKVPIVGNIVSGLTKGITSNYQTNPANVQQAVNTDQTSQAYQQIQDALNQQRLLASKLSGQGGLQTQNNTLAQQQELANQIKSGVINPNQAALEAELAKNAVNPNADQELLAKQLLAESQGQGPNPAQDQYKQNIDANTAAAAGTIASQKGISPALAAELIARQQGGANQNAAANAAALQAQQQLNAQNQLQTQQGLQQTTQAQKVAQLQNQQALQQQQQLQSQQQLQNQQNSIQGIAQNQIGGEQNAVNAISGTALQNQNSLLGGIGQFNTTNTNAINEANRTNAGVAAQNTATQGGLIGGLLNSAGGIATQALKNSGSAPSTSPSAAAVLAGAEGGLVKKDAIISPNGKNKKIVIPDHFKHISMIYHGPELMAEGGQIDQDYEDSPNTYLKPEWNSDQKKFAKKISEQFAKGGEACYQEGAMVPGTPKVNHNSYSNDVVSAKLSPGEIVVPLDVMNSKDPAEGAKRFVQALLDKKANSGDKDREAFHAALKTAISQRKSK